MSATEYALVHSAVDCELRACAGMLAVWLMLFLKIALLAWLVLAGVWLSTQIAGHMFVKQVLPAPGNVAPHSLAARLYLRVGRKYGNAMTGHALLVALIILLLSPALLADQSSSLAARKSKTAAAAYSIATTLIPEGVSILMLARHGNHSNTSDRAWFLFGLSGPVFGPGAGHLYAENSQRFSNGTLFRLCLTAVGSAAILSTESDTAGVVALSSRAIVAFSMIYDIATVGKSVDKYNHSHGFSDLRLTPTYFASQHALGLALRLTF